MIPGIAQVDNGCRSDSPSQDLFCEGDFDFMQGAAELARTSAPVLAGDDVAQSPVYQSSELTAVGTLRPPARRQTVEVSERRTTQ